MLLCVLATLLPLVNCQASVPINLGPYFNAKAASNGLNSRANFDGSGRAYPAEWLPSETNFMFSGVNFTLPQFHSAQALDTVKSNGQKVNIPGNRTYQSFHALAAAVWPPSSYSQARAGNLTLNFADGTSYIAGIIVAPWYSDSPFDGPIHTPWHYSNSSLDYNSTIDHNITHIHYVTTRVPNNKVVTSVTLPAQSTFINFFSISLLATDVQVDDGPKLSIQSVRSTTKWMQSSSGDRIQQVEILLNNLSPLNGSLSQWVTSPHAVSLSSSSLDTVVPATIQRLRSNDQALLKVGVQNKPGVEVGSNATVDVVVRDQNGTIIQASQDQGWTVTAGIPEWQSNDESLATHEAPEWFDDAKFGIFIHWGVYSVPAWAPTGQQYAEWYNWQFHNPASSASPTWVHHLHTYGSSVVYDDFIANFTASQWNPDDWTDLFWNAGARYFVLVSKHHEGFAMFDAGNSSDRNAVKMGPKRDILKDLFTSAKTRHPELHRGTYFSLPEWFNPDYAPYARTKFPGKPALNAFNGSCCDPYLGHIPVENFIDDVQKPQLEKLFYEYETEILWCDADGKSAFPSIAADWYNYAAAQNRQVTRSNRCGSNQTDFVTPEYVTFPARLSQKWESSAGMDPFSYGYNSDTPPQNYAKASDLVVELVDIVSKGGNFLLDIGPMSDGTIISEESGPLLEIGVWLNASGEAIYSTRPWYIQPAGDVGGDDVRFTTTEDAFFIIAVKQPSNGRLVVKAPVPIKQGDAITMLGGSGQPLAWSYDGQGGVLTITVADAELDKVQYAWAFKLSYI